jgi:hypothetical protein
MSGLTVRRTLHVTTRHKGRKQLEPGTKPPEVPAGRVPRVSRLMALALRFEWLLAAGVVKDQAELARLGHVTRARLTQIMNLLNLAPDIQEALLFLPRVERGKDPLTERQLRPIAAEPDWQTQRRMWRRRIRVAGVA